MRFSGSNIAKDMGEQGAKRRRPGKRGFPAPSLGASPRCSCACKCLFGTVPGTQWWQESGARTPVWHRKSAGGRQAAPLPSPGCGALHAGRGGDMVRPYCCRVHAPHQAGLLTRTTLREDTGHGLHRHQQPRGRAKALRGRRTHMGRERGCTAHPQACRPDSRHGVWAQEVGLNAYA